MNLGYQSERYINTSATYQSIRARRWSSAYQSGLRQRRSATKTSAPSHEEIYQQTYSINDNPRSHSNNSWTSARASILLAMFRWGVLRHMLLKPSQNGSNAGVVLQKQVIVWLNSIYNGVGKLTDEFHILMLSMLENDLSLSRSTKRMKCPDCHGTHIRKNGHRQHKQNYICVSCGRQFLAQYEPRGYSDDIKQLCLKMYLNGMGCISRDRDFACDDFELDWTIWERLPDSYYPKQIPKWGTWWTLETLWAQKQNKLWIWTVVDHFQPEFSVG